MVRVERYEHDGLVRGAAAVRRPGSNRLPTPAAAEFAAFKAGLGARLPDDSRG